MGSAAPASVHEIARLAQMLRDSIFARTKKGMSEERTLRTAFQAIDADGSGEVSFQEFVNALSRFGLQLCDGPGGRVQGGVRHEAMWGLYTRWNMDGSPTLSYTEFCNGLLKPNYEEYEELPFSNLKLQSLNGKQVMVLPENDRAPAGSAANAAACAVRALLPSI